MKIAIAGSTGLIGEALVSAASARGNEVVRIVRAKGSGIRWDPAKGALDAEALEGFDAVVNLAGASIGGKRWNPSYKKSILDSRVNGTKLLASAIASLANPPAVFVGGSAVGYYGAVRGDEVLTEQSSPGTGFLADTCRLWEGATSALDPTSVRVVHIRTGLVLARNGGLLKRLTVPFKLLFGGPIGAGDQWWPWITLRDEVSAILHAINSPLSGPINLCAPEPQRQRDFAKALGKVLRRPAVAPLPAGAVRLAFGKEMADETVLAGQRALPGCLLESGFRFEDSSVSDGLSHIFS